MAEIGGLPIPVIAAIHGACLAVGLSWRWPVTADLHRRCENDSGPAEVQLGLLPGSGGTQRLPRLVGVSTALEMILTVKQLRPVRR